MKASDCEDKHSWKKRYYLSSDIIGVRGLDIFDRRFPHILTRESVTRILEYRALEHRGFKASVCLSVDSKTI